jgi:tetratricopeptide (TPR) repeat protein
MSTNRKVTTTNQQNDTEKNITGNVNQVESKWWKYAFWGIAAIIMFLMMLNANSVGSGGDDLWYGTNGEFVLRYYLDGDTSCLDYSKVEYHNMTPNYRIKYFAGGGFDIIPAAISRIFHIDNTLLVKRFCLAFIGFLLMLFTGLIGKEIRNWRLATIALLMITLTPNIFGLSFCGGQDVPTAMGFAMAIYGLIIFTRDLPNISIKGSIFTFLGIMFAISVRIAGLMTLLFFFVAVMLELIGRQDLRQLFVNKNIVQIVKILGISLIIGIAAAFLGLCAYPNIFHEGIISHIKTAFDTVNKFSVRIPFIYDGKMAESTNPPEHYLLYSLLRTLPYFIIIGTVLFLAFIIRIFKNYRKTAIIFLLFTALFPPIYIVASHANIYNGWRHLLFFYAPFAVLVSIGWYELIEFVKPKKLKETIYYPIVAVVMLLIVSPTMIWMFKNHNYIYCYYNKSVGNPYLKFELDYYETSATRAYDWLRENELNKTDSLVTVSTKIFTPIYYAEMLGDTNHVKVFTTSYMGFAETYCDYSIINFHVIQPKAIKKFFPPKGTIHVEEVDGNPICAVVKRNKLDSRGIRCIREGKIAEGVALLDSAYKFDPDNFGIWFWAGLGHYQIKDYEKCIEYFDKDMGFLPTQDKLMYAAMYKGSALYELGRYNEAITSLITAEQQCTDRNQLPFIKAHLGLSYFAKGDYNNAIPQLQAALPVYPFLANQLNTCLAHR